MGLGTLGVEGTGTEAMGNIVESRDLVLGTGGCWEWKVVRGKMMM